MNNLTATMKNDDRNLFGLKFLLFISMVVNHSSAFTFQCPSPFQWNIRAGSQCSIKEGYICLFDDNTKCYTEICRNKTYLDPAGYKFVLAGNPDRQKCESTRYQPFKFSTYGRSVCIFEKTYCSDEGQIIFNNGSTKSDRQCQCDYTRDYDFITKPKHSCYCNPSIEDCSCYKKSCPRGFAFSPDYQCINLTSWNSQFTCKLIPPNKPKDKNHPSIDNNLGIQDDSAAAQERNERITLRILIGVTIVVTLMIVKKNIELMSTLVEKVIPQNIRDLQKKVKDQWEEQFISFVETRASVAITDKFNEEQCLLISGPNGCGKSALAFHIALKYKESLGFDFMIISHIDELVSYASVDKKQLFLIDDVFGKYSVSEYDTMLWNCKRERIHCVLTRNKDLKLLMTSRSYIYQSANLEQVKVRFYHFNLISKDLELRFEERKKIGRCLLKDSTIDDISEEIVMSYCFFPAICASFGDQKEENVHEYFTHPILYCMTELENSLKSSDLFCLVFSVLIICNNSVEKKMFNKANHKYDEMLKYLSKEIAFGWKVSKRVLFSRFIALKYSHISEKISSFECINVDLFNTFAFCLSPKIMRSILYYGTTAFITERMQLESSIGHYPKLTIIVPNSLEEIYFERMLKDIKTGLHDTFKGNQQIISEFRKSYITYMTKHLRKGDLERGIDGTTVLHVVSAEGYEEYVEYFLELDKYTVNQQDNYGQGALHKACMKGHMKVIRLLLDYGAMIDLSDNDDKTALDVACSIGLVDTVELLLSRNATIRQKKTDLKSVLHVACNNNYFEIAKLLLKKQAAVNVRDEHGHTPLHLACMKGHLQIVELLIKYKPNVNIVDNKGRAALYFAAGKNDVKIVQYLLKLDAKPDMLTDKKRVPLHRACLNGSLEIVKLLIQKKVTVDIYDEKQCTPLYFACKNGHVTVVDYLMQNKANAQIRNQYRNTPILIACENNHVDIVQILLDSEADVNCKNVAELTPLHVACFNNYSDIVLLLIRYGALVDEPDKNLQTPLCLACSRDYNIVVDEKEKQDIIVTKADKKNESSHNMEDTNKNKETVKVLLNAGANGSMCEKNGITPLHMACKAGRVEIVKLLINAGVDVNKGDKNGITPLDMAREGRQNEILPLLLNVKYDVNIGLMSPLHMACKDGNEANVKELLYAGACVNEIDSDGRIPLHLACKGGHEEIVNMLINAGVNVNKGDMNGVTPLHIACIEGNEAIVRVFLNSVANVKIMDKDGLTPLDVAYKHRHNDIATLLINVDPNENKIDEYELLTVDLVVENEREEPTNVFSNGNDEVD